MTALKENQNPLFVGLRQKLDLMPSMDHSVEAVLQGSHAYLEASTYGRIMMGRALRVSN